MPKTLGLMGKKIGMTRVFSEQGSAIPVTVIEVGPCVVLQIKTVKKEGYNAIQIGYSPKKKSRINMPEAGHCKASGQTGFYHIMEFWVANTDDYELGQTIFLSDIFNVGDLLDVSGRIKGRGFQGVVKRYGFKGGSATHGSKFHRRPGSIGCSAWPARVVKGKKMPGRMGNNLVTKKNITIIDILPEDNILLVKGSVPGSGEGLLHLYSK